MSRTPVLSMENISVSYRSRTGWQQVLTDVSLEVFPGEVFGLVGESGCGKSTLAYQMLAYRHPNARLDGGAVRLDGADLHRLSMRELEDMRGKRIGFVAQNPTTALNPNMRVGDQISETLHRHAPAMPHAALRDEVRSLLERVGLPGDAATCARYPHQLSGGQQQRVAIAIAISCKPALIVLDEPTTGLDVTTQRQIVDLLGALRREANIAIVYVTHDLLLLREIADRVAVMYAGEIVETGPIEAVFREPAHPYSGGLIASIPQISEQGHFDHPPLRGLLQRDTLPPGCPFQPRCDFGDDTCVTRRQALEPVTTERAVACWKWRSLAPARNTASDDASADSRHGAAGEELLDVSDLCLGYGYGSGLIDFLVRPGGVKVVDGFDFSIHSGEAVGLIGESGSGKSTIARAVCGLIGPRAGNIRFDRSVLAPSIRQRLPAQRREIQYIFQNPDASLNPRMKIGEILARPAAVFFNAQRSELDRLAREALAGVQLDETYVERYPDELSGGERQRVAIARALIAKPRLLLCDEILSALDVSVQARILALLRTLRRDLNVAMLFISHDLTVVRSLVDRVGVLYRGVLVECGSVEDLFAPPFHPYTQNLLRAVPTGGSLVRRAPAAPVATEPAGNAGCVFFSRCAYRIEGTCDRIAPPERSDRPGRMLRCHLTLESLHDRTAPEGAAALEGVVE